jgi:hypothetical protein
MGALIVTAIVFYYKGVFGQSRRRGILFCLRYPANMFCERCGCIMEEGTYTCPECGAYYGPVAPHQELPPWRYLIISFVISAAAMSFISWSVGVYAILFLLFAWVGKRPRTKGEMILKGVSLGLMAGCIIGLCLKYFVGSVEDFFEGAFEAFLLA